MSKKNIIVSDFYYMCPHCGEVIKELVVTVKAFGWMSLKDNSIHDLESEEILETECPYCGREVGYD